MFTIGVLLAIIILFPVSMKTCPDCKGNGVLFGCDRCKDSGAVFRWSRKK